MRHVVVHVPLELRGLAGWRFLVIDTEQYEAVGGFREMAPAFEERDRRNGEEDRS